MGPKGQRQGPEGPRPADHPALLAAHAAAIAKGLGAQLIPLDSPNAKLVGTNLGRSWDGQIYVATPQLLRAFGITASEIDPNADILSSRPGLSGVSGLELNYGSGQKLGPPGLVVELHGGDGLPRPPGHPRGRRPAARDLGAEHGDHRARDARVPHPDGHERLAGPGIAALHGRRRSATPSSPRRRPSCRWSPRTTSPRSDAVISWATIFGIVIALGVLGMSVGLVRSETAERSANPRRHRSVELHPAHADRGDRRCARLPRGAPRDGRAATSACIGWLRGNSLNGGIAALGNVPVDRPPPHPRRHARVRRGDRVAVRRSRALRHGPPADRMRRDRRRGSDRGGAVARCMRAHGISNLPFPSRAAEAPRGA